MFEQHYAYLDIVKKQGELNEEDYQMIKENKDNFSPQEYTKYYNIFPKSLFEDTVFMAVYSLWKNDGLGKLRVN